MAPEGLATAAPRNQRSQQATVVLWCRQVAVPRSRVWRRRESAIDSCRTGLLIYWARTAVFWAICNEEELY